MLTYLGILLRARTRNERGASAVEYALLIAGIAVLSIVALEGLGATLRAVFEHSQSNIECHDC